VSGQSASGAALRQARRSRRLRLRARPPSLPTDRDVPILFCFPGIPTSSVGLFSMEERLAWQPCSYKYKTGVEHQILLTGCTRVVCSGESGTLCAEFILCLLQSHRSLLRYCNNRGCNAGFSPACFVFLVQSLSWQMHCLILVLPIQARSPPRLASGWSNLLGRPRILPPNFHYLVSLRFCGVLLPSVPALQLHGLVRRLPYLVRRRSGLPALSPYLISARFYIKL